MASFGNDRVLRYEGTDGTFIDTFVAPGAGGLDGPEGLAFGADGHLYVASSGTHSVLRYNGTTGAFINIFVAAHAGGLDGPVGLAFGLDGHLYVASFNNDRVLRYNKANGALIGNGIFVAAGSGGLDGPTYLLWNPVKVVDRNGGPDVYTTIQAAVNALPASGRASSR